jgi:hypothetical protein
MGIDNVGGADQARLAVGQRGIAPRGKGSRGSGDGSVKIGGGRPSIVIARLSLNYSLPLLHACL